MHRFATIGVFDGVHRGHRYLLHQLCTLAAEKGMTPTVFTFDRHPLEIIAPERAPMIISTPAQRAEVMVDCGVLDVIIMVFNKHMRELTDREFLRMLHDDYGVRALLLGYNHRFGHKSEASVDEYRRMGHETGIEIYIADEYRDESGEKPLCSSSVREYLSAGDLDKAEAMMGHPFVVRGKVVKGRGIGHTIGFPTINIQTIKKRQLLPAQGVYAAIAKLPGGRRRKAMVNVGVNPTVSDVAEAPHIEAHLLDFNENLYGAPVELQFVKRLRDEKKFPSTEALAEALRQDRVATEEAVGSEW